MKVHVQLGDNSLTFTSDLARRLFFERNKGKYAFLVIDDAPTSEMRRYFEGALVPAVYYQHPQRAWADFGECREALKYEFLPHRDYTTTNGTKRVTTATSTANLSKSQFRAFVEAITNWMIKNGLEFPDSAEYLEWKNSAPAANEVFPQLKRLREQYVKKRKI